MKAALAALAILAGPAAAQDIRFGREATEACLAGATGFARLDCAGASAQACIEATPDAYTTVGMGICFDEEFRYWDGRLNAAYQALVTVTQATDDEMKDLGSLAPPQVPALREMQRAWIVWRDAACAYERSTWGGGTGGGPASVACAMQITAAQALALEDRVARMEPQ